MDNTKEENIKNFIEGVKDTWADGRDMEELLNGLEDTLDFGNWDVRTWFRDPHMFALNVKGKGFGDYDKINKDGRFSDLGYDENSYYDYNQSNNQILFEEYERTFDEKFALSLYAGGRMGGWWGFKIDDLDSSFEYCFEWDSQKLNDFYESYGLPLFADASEFDSELDWYELGQEAADEHFDELFGMIKFKPEFKQSLEEFAGTIYRVSDDMEADAYNDEAFENITSYE